nr:MAG TPA: hypothetical protein [Caudoviricetes sp.]
MSLTQLLRYAILSGIIAPFLTLRHFSCCNYLDAAQ